MQAAGRLGPQGQGRCLSPSPAPHCREVPSLQVPSVPLSPILMQESQASEHSPWGQKGLACGAANPSPSPAPRDCSIPSNVQKAEEQKGRHSPGSQQQPGGERETGRQQGQKVLLNLYNSLTKQGKSSKIPSNFLSPGPLLPHEQDLCPPPVWPLHQDLGRMAFGQRK